METAKHMTSKVIRIGPRDTLSKAKALMDSENVPHVPVVEEDGKLIGILPEGDIRSHVGYLESTRVDAVMTLNPMTVSPTTTVEQATRLMLRLKISAVPVVDEGKLVGVLTTTDILRAFLEVERTEEISELMGKAVGLWTYVYDYRYADSQDQR
jgi:acetoin utilization protein AcuB